MEKRWRVGIVTNEDPKDRRVWSGITSYIFQALQQVFDEVVVLGPLQPEKAGLRKAYFISRKIAWILEIFTRKISKTRHAYEFGLIHGYVSSQFFERQLKNAGEFDFLVVPASHVSVSLLQTKIPIILVSDATFHLLNGYYPDLTGLSLLSRKEFFATEKLAFNKAAYIIYSSQWAANSAMNDYGVTSDKIKVIPFGANIDNAPTRESVIQLRQKFTYKLLFVGVTWERKGGSIALECVAALRSMGIDVELTICGCEPWERVNGRYVNVPVDSTYVKVIKFLDKNQPADYDRFIELLKESDFLLSPTRADCTPIVFCEAAAYGLPVITTDTGGISEVVDEGKTGFLLPYEAPGSEYAKLIASLYADKVAYDRLVLNSWEKYEKVLNWRAWVKSFRSIVTHGFTE